MSTTTSPAPGKIGGALKFNGTTNYISLLNGPNTGNTYSVSMWRYPIPASHNWSELYAQGSAAGLYYMGPSRKIDFASATDFTNNTALIENRWHYVTAVVSGVNVTLYADGAQDGTGASGTSFNLRTMGGDSAGNGYKGLIDDVRIYNRALSAQEVQQLYLLGK
jgi:hypothetical protein